MPLSIIYITLVLKSGIDKGMVIIEQRELFISIIKDIERSSINVQK